MKTQRASIWIWLLLSSLAIPAAQAQNLVANPHFDNDLSGWPLSGGSAAWDARDFAGDSHSGSISEVAAGSVSTVQQCIPTGPGSYLLSAEAYQATIQGGTGSAGVVWFARQTIDCSPGPILASGSLPAPATRGVWLGLSGLVVAPAGTQAIEIELITNKLSGSQFSANFDDVTLTSDCSSDPTALCFGFRGRFKVTAAWATSKASGIGTPVVLGSDSGYFTFFDPANVELVVKVLDGCGVNGYFWVFSSGLTNVRVDLMVFDRAAGTTKHYINPLNRAYPPLQDTTAFSGCS